MAQNMLRKEPNADDPGFAYLHLLEILPENIHTFVKAILCRPDFPERLAVLSGILWKKGQKEAARTLAWNALEMAPDNVRVRRHTFWAVQKSVPEWHFKIVNDMVRNRIYEKALMRYVTSDAHVLEIGAGTGILAMQAARAGARRVTTCEKELPIVEAAREIVERNGFGRKIHIVPKELEALRLGEDMPERADMLVSEIVDNGLLGERVIPLVAYARKHLLKPGAIILPGRASARGMLVDGEPFINKYRLGDVSGFDLSPFERFRPPTITMGQRAAETTALSHPMDLLTLDFQAGAETANAPRNVDFTVQKDGVAGGVLQWIRLCFDQDLVLENAPECPSETWTPLCHLFPAPAPLKRGDIFRVCVSFDEKHIFIEPAGVLNG